MKKIISVLLLLAVCITALLCTSCAGQSEGDGTLYEQSIVFIYGDSDAADYFLNLEFFSTTKTAAAGFVDTWNIITPAISTLFSLIWDNILNILLFWVIAIVVLFILTCVTGWDFITTIGAVVMILPLIILLIALIISMFVLLGLAAFMIYAIIFDLATIIFTALAILIFGLCRWFEYIMIDLGWGEYLIENSI